MSVNELVEQWLFEYACRHCLYTALNGNKICTLTELTDEWYIDLGAAQSSIFGSARIFFRLAQPARAENYGSTAIMHLKLMHAPTGPVTSRSCRCMSTCAAIYVVG